MEGTTGEAWARHQRPQLPARMADVKPNTAKNNVTRFMCFCTIPSLGEFHVTGQFDDDALVPRPHVWKVLLEANDKRFWVVIHHVDTRVPRFGNTVLGWQPPSVVVHAIVPRLSSAEHLCATGFKATVAKMLNTIHELLTCSFAID